MKNLTWKSRIKKMARVRKKKKLTNNKSLWGHWTHATNEIKNSCLWLYIHQLFKQFRACHARKLPLLPTPATSVMVHYNVTSHSSFEKNHSWGMIPKRTLDHWGKMEKFGIGKQKWVSRWGWTKMCLAVVKNGMGLDGWEFRERNGYEGCEWKWGWYV